VALGTLVTIGSGPVFAGLLGAVLLREAVEASWLVATATCVVGLALLSLSGAAEGAADPLGLLLALTSGAAYAAYTVAAKQCMRAGRRPSDVMASAFGLGGLLLLPLLATQPLAWLSTPGGWVLATYLGLVTTTVAYLLFGRGSRCSPPGR
jgi:DME family drug/metabolite transporter